MNISEQGIGLIKSFEGCALEPYSCPAGKPTIGYGHVLSPHESSEAITEDEAEALLLQDLAHYEALVEQLVKVKLTQPQFDALVAFCFNIGGKSLEKSTLLRLLNQGDYEGAAGQFERWVYAGGRKLAGLKRRRAAEKQLFLKNSAIT